MMVMIRVVTMISTHGQHDQDDKVVGKYIIYVLFILIIFFSPQMLALKMIRIVAYSCEIMKKVQLDIKRSKRDAGLVH